MKVVDKSGFVLEKNGKFLVGSGQMSFMRELSCMEKAKGLPCRIFADQEEVQEFGAKYTPAQLDSIVVYTIDNEGVTTKVEALELFLLSKSGRMIRAMRKELKRNS